MLLNHSHHGNSQPCLCPALLAAYLRSPSFLPSSLSPCTFLRAACTLGSLGSTPGSPAMAALASGAAAAGSTTSCGQHSQHKTRHMRHVLYQTSRALKQAKLMPLLVDMQASARAFITELFLPACSPHYAYVLLFCVQIGQIYAATFASNTLLSLALPLTFVGYSRAPALTVRAPSAGHHPGPHQA